MDGDAYPKGCEELFTKTERLQKVTTEGDDEDSWVGKITVIW